MPPPPLPLINFVQTTDAVEVATHEGGTYRIRVCTPLRSKDLLEEKAFELPLPKSLLLFYTQQERTRESPSGQLKPFA